MYLLSSQAFLLSLLVSYFGDPSADIHFLLQVVFLGFGSFPFSLNLTLLAGPHLAQGIGPMSSPCGTLKGHLFLAQLGSWLCHAAWSHQPFAFRVTSKKKSLCSPSLRRPRLLFLRYFLKPPSFHLH